MAETIPRSRNELAEELGFKAKTFAYIIYGIPKRARYKERIIEKRCGRKRQILAPHPEVKEVQKSLARWLLNRWEKERHPNPELRRVSHAFQKTRSIVSNAKRHSRQRYVLNVDLEDFFPSFNFGRVRGFFLARGRFRLSPEVATTIAEIACHDNALPQGSPCSPIISEMITEKLDKHLLRLAKQHRLRLTRYVDDISFSSQQECFPSEIAYPKGDDSSEWDAGQSLKDVVERSGFKINERKTRMQFRTGRQTVTGLVVNQRVNVRSEYFRHTRAMCHHLFRHGRYQLPTPNTQETQTCAKSLEDRRPLRGRILHTLHARGERVSDGLVQSHDPYPSNKGKKSGAISGAQTLYSLFIDYDLFIDGSAPLIICEGKTDPVYLRCAIHALAREDQKLRATLFRNDTLNLRFFNSEAAYAKNVGATGGVVTLKEAVHRYRKSVPHFSRKYGRKSVTSPTVIVVDSDKGMRDLNKQIKQNQRPNIIDCEKDFSKDQINLGLYYVTLPETNKEIESCFHSSDLSRKSGHRVFELDPNRGGKSETYGKVEFVKVMLKHRDEFNFEGFRVLLSRICGAINDFDQTA